MYRKRNTWIVLAMTYITLNILDFNTKCHYFFCKGEWYYHVSKYIHVFTLTLYSKYNLLILHFPSSTTHEYYPKLLSVFLYLSTTGIIGPLETMLLCHSSLTVKFSANSWLYLPCSWCSSQMFPQWCSQGRFHQWCICEQGKYNVSHTHYTVHLILYIKKQEAFYSLCQNWLLYTVHVL